MKKKIPSPICKGIRISWDYSEEFIGLDLSSLKPIPQISTTIEWWPEEKVWVRYNTTSSKRRLSNGDVEIRIVYAQSNNKHLDSEEICWGKATITINPNTLSGTATWDDADCPDNRVETSWEQVDVPLRGEKKRENVSRIQRNQEQFRSALVAYDKCCAITGEKTENALEAAHIIPASAGGSEVIENGIVLRADLHRLMDKKLFSIDLHGRVVINEKMSKAYMETLTGVTISKLIIARVSEALQYVAKSPGRA